MGVSAPPIFARKCELKLVKILNLEKGLYEGIRQCVKGLCKTLKT